MATFKQVNREIINGRVSIATQAAIFICGAGRMFIELSEANKFSPQNPGKTM